MKITKEEKTEHLIEKLNKLSFLLGIYSGSLLEIRNNIPDKSEFDEIRDRITILLNRMSSDLESLFYGDKI